MATVRHVCNLALRKLGVTAGGRDARDVDLTDALDALRGLYGSWIASGAFGRLQDVVPTGTNYTTPGGERIYRQNADVLEVTLPEMVSEQFNNDYGHERTGYYGTVVTIDTVGNTTTVTVEPGQPIGYVLPPRDGSAVIISDQVGGQYQSWLYDGTIKKWQSVEDMTLDDPAPRSVDVQGLASCLAIELSDQFANEVMPQTGIAAGRYTDAMVVQFGMRREAAMGVYF